MKTNFPKQPHKQFKSLKSIAILFTIIFIAELVIMSSLGTIVSDKVPPWGFSILDGIIISIVSVLTIFYLNSISLIDLKQDGKSEIIILKVGTIIFSIEAIIMFLFSIYRDTLNWWQENLIDSLVLSVTAVILIYFTIIKPNLKNEERTSEEIVNESLVTNIILFISFALLLLLLLYIVYKQNAEHNEVLVTMLFSSYILFLIVSFFTLLILNRANVKNIQQETYINNLANIDPLTNLGNRRHFELSLNRALQKSSDLNRKVALILLDLNKFKPINDSYGHDVGDLTLKETALRIEQCTRKNDISCRLGGDEFAIIMPEVSSTKEAENVAKRILNAFDDKFNIAGFNIDVGISIGIALSQGDETMLSLSKRADKAMYQSKKNGVRYYIA